MSAADTHDHKTVSATELSALLAAGQAIVVDVREPDEFVSGHIVGAVNLPLSRFAAEQLPDAPGKKIVLQCAGGKRSGMALDRCAQAQVAVDTHLDGGLASWKAAGLPMVA